MKSGDCHAVIRDQSRLAMTEILKDFRQPENEVLIKSKRVSANKVKLKLLLDFELCKNK